MSDCRHAVCTWPRTDGCDFGGSALEGGVLPTPSFGDPVGVADGCDNCTRPTECLP